MNWWQRLLNRNRLERELDAELRYHFDRQVDDNIRMGMSEEEARRCARVDLGGEAQLKESCRDARGTRWVEDVEKDFRFAARLLLKDRSFTVPAVIALALGIVTPRDPFRPARRAQVRVNPELTSPEPNA